jgi:hypothetical protein
LQAGWLLYPIGAAARARRVALPTLNDARHRDRYLRSQTGGAHAAAALAYEI